MKNLNIEQFDNIDFLPRLLKYFALSPNNKVIGKGYFSNVMITYFQDDNGAFHKITDLGDGGEPLETILNSIDLDTLFAIISQLETLPSTMGEEYAFKNMKEQIWAMSTAYVDPRWNSPRHQKIIKIQKGEQLYGIY